MNTTTLALIEGHGVDVLPTEVTTIETPMGTRVLEALVTVGGVTYDVAGSVGEWPELGCDDEGRPAIYVISAPGPVYDLVELFDWAG